MKRAEAIALGDERVRVPIQARYVVNKRDGTTDSSFTYGETTIRKLAKLLVEKLGSDLLIEIDDP